MAIVNLMEQNRKLEISRADELHRFKKEMAEAIPVIEQLQTMKPFTNSDESLQQEVREALEEMSSTLLAWPQRAEMFRREHSIIESLRFEGMLHRHSDIANAHDHTFKWVHDHNLHFNQWLESGDGFYWVTGDPGSGKSTLIKYLYEDPVTHDALKGWASPKSLVKASFYFWFSGTPLQKSLEGLLRSLLFELLRQSPDSIQSACHARWSVTEPLAWTERELLEALKSLRLNSPSTRFCFFIDGLDEYQGGSKGPDYGNVPNEISRIIDVMNILASLPDVKLCISSRPWQAFEEAFGKLDSRKFYVNDQNRDDMRLYIQDKFAQSTVFAHSEADPQELKDLVNEMVQDSKGVFLWVFLAVESLLRGLRKKDGLPEVRRRLAQTPKTLNTMFEKGLASVEEIYHEQAAQIIQVALRANEPLNVFPYSFIGDDGYDAIKAEIRAWDADECADLAKTTEVRIWMRCPDLLKVRSPREAPKSTQQLGLYRVDFLHRTVRDFLALDDTQRSLKKRLQSPFNPLEFICNTLLMQIKASSSEAPCPHTWLTNGLHDLLESLIDFTRELEIETDKPQTVLLNELARVLASLSGEGELFLYGESFTGTMIQKDLFRYTETRLPDALHQRGRPLLEYALVPILTWRNPATYPSPQMVTLLLKHGAKPHQLTSSAPLKSVWEVFMTTAYDQHKKRTGEQSQTQRQNEILIVQELLQHGADPHLKHIDKWTDPRVTVGKAKGIRYPTYIDLLEMIRAMYSQDERRYIEALIRDRRAGVLPKWLRWN